MFIGNVTCREASRSINVATTRVTKSGILLCIAFTLELDIGLK